VQAPAPVHPLQPAAPATPVPLARAAYTVGELLHVAQASGVTHARLNLRPAELGGIEIRLVSDASGVTATVLADSPEAAKLLQDASGDLRRQLERSGVTVAGLDIGTQARQDGGAGGDASSGRRGSGSGGSGATELAADEPAVVTHTIVLPDGVRVDVLA
jgi:flagellar hook-length control protein FliK